MDVSIATLEGIKTGTEAHGWVYSGLGIELLGKIRRVASDGWATAAGWDKTPGGYEWRMEEFGHYFPSRGFCSRL